MATKVFSFLYISELAMVQRSNKSIVTNYYIRTYFFGVQNTHKSSALVVKALQPSSASQDQSLL